MGNREVVGSEEVHAEEQLPLCPWCGAPARISESIWIGCSNLTSCSVKPSAKSSDLETAKAKWRNRTRSVNLEQMTKEQLEWLLVEAQSELLVRLGQKLDKEKTE